jgi:hypothetical protein
VNVGRGTFFAYNADALQDFTDKPLLPASSTVEPTLRDANSAASSDGGAIASIEGDGSCPQSLDYHSGIDAVSAVLMANTVYGEYLTAGSLGADTDWVLTFPTKAFYVDKRVYPGNPRARSNIRSPTAFRTFRFPARSTAAKEMERRSLPARAPHSSTRSTFCPFAPDRKNPAAFSDRATRTVWVLRLPVTPATSRSISRAMHTFWKADEPPTAKP